MNKKIGKAIGFVLLSGFLFTGCKSSQPVVSQPTTEQDVSSTGIYRNMLNEAKKQYQNGELDAASGTLQLLLQNELSNEKELKQEAENLQKEINLAQSKDKKNEELTKIKNETKYKTERVSDLAATEFEEDTGGDIVSASDSEIKTWLENKKDDTNRRVSSKNPEDETTDAVVEEMEEQEQVLIEVTDKIGIEAKEYEFFIIKTDDHMYQIEIRQANEMDGISISNMIGIFKYNFETKSLEKMNPITGEFDLFTNEHA